MDDVKVGETKQNASNLGVQDPSSSTRIFEGSFTF